MRVSGLAVTWLWLQLGTKLPNCAQPEIVMTINNGNMSRIILTRFIRRG